MPIADLYTNMYNINLGLFGISVTVFTVIYSFIISRRNDVVLFQNQQKQGDNSPSLKQKISFSKSNIGKLKKINKSAIGMMLLSLLLFVVFFVLRILNLGSDDHTAMMRNITLLTLLVEFLVVGVLLYRILKYYKSSTKI